jgi:hypothetical protein
VRGRGDDAGTDSGVVLGSVGLEMKGREVNRCFILLNKYLFFQYLILVVFVSVKMRVMKL